MVQVGNVPAIVDVKNRLSNLKKSGAVREWELPFENLLTRLDAAIFFLSPSSDTQLEEIWASLRETPHFTYQKNDKCALSDLDWQVEFNPKR